MGMWYAGERVAAEPYDHGELAVICVVNWTENEQDWSSVQFVPTATVLIFVGYLCNICRNGIHILYIYILKNKTRIFF